jgi:hypothetical protein
VPTSASASGACSWCAFVAKQNGQDSLHPVACGDKTETSCPTPKPTPAPAETYKCENSKCVVRTGGVSKTVCEENCAKLPTPAPPAPHPEPTPAPATTYKCEKGKCVVKAGGVSKTLCEDNCATSPTPPPTPAELYRCKDDQCVVTAGGIEKALCEELCGGTSPTPSPPGPEPKPTPAPPVPPTPPNPTPSAPTPVPKPPGKGGLKACQNYVKALKPALNNQVVPLQIAAIWMRATADMKGGRGGKVSGCDIDPKGCKDVCVAAVTQALGECQSFSNPLNMTTGGCKIHADSSDDGGIWQVCVVHESSPVFSPSLDRSRAVRPRPTLCLTRFLRHTPSTSTAFRLTPRFPYPHPHSCSSYPHPHPSLSAGLELQHRRRA